MTLKGIPLIAQRHPDIMEMGEIEVWVTMPSLIYQFATRVPKEPEEKEKP